MPLESLLSAPNKRAGHRTSRGFGSCGFAWREVARLAASPERTTYIPRVRSPFGITLAVTLAVGFAAQLAGLPFPVVAVLAVAAGLVADAIVRRRQEP